MDIAVELFRKAPEAGKIMKSLCFFSSYFNGNSIPYYVRYYLENIRGYFTDMYFLSDKKILDKESAAFLSAFNIRTQFSKNEGMDFGMWKKAIANINVLDYDRVALINDSCILYKSPDDFFKWNGINEYDFCGMVLSGKFTTHLQSYFLIFNTRAIPLLKEFFTGAEILHSYKDIIHTQELGLSRFMTGHGMKTGGMYDFSKRKDVNPSFILAGTLIEMGCPLIKKKIFTRKFSAGDYLTWFRNKYIFNPVHYINKIIAVNGDKKLIDFKRVMRELNAEVTFMQSLKYSAGQLAYNILRRVPFAKDLFHKAIELKRRSENGR